MLSKYGIFVKFLFEKKSCLHSEKLKKHADLNAQTRVQIVRMGERRVLKIMNFTKVTSTSNLRLLFITYTHVHTKVL